MKQILILLGFLIFAVHVHAAVVINEIYPKTDPSANAWVELYNNGGSEVSVNQWKLDHTASSSYFTLNANVIAPHGYLLLTGAQTAISFSINGDTVRLFDEKGNQADNQSYPGTLGYNTSMGRTSDGGGSWAPCTTATPNASNNCPEPSPTATPIPTNTPMPTPTPTPTPTSYPSPTPTQQTFGSLLPTPMITQVLGVTANITPIPTPTKSPDVFQLTIYKPWIAYTLLGIAGVAVLYMLILWARQRHIRK